MGLQSIIGGEKSEKLGYSLYKKLILLKVHTNIPNIRDLWFKNIQWERICRQNTPKLGIFDEIFRKIGKFAFIGVKLGLKNLTNWVEHTENSHNSWLYTYNTNQWEILTYCLKIWHFLKCHNNCYFNKRNCSHTKISRSN